LYIHERMGLPTCYIGPVQRLVPKEHARIRTVSICPNNYNTYLTVLSLS
jgi:hypothetical protein